MVATAASYYNATLTVTTGLSAPFNNLAIIYKQQVSVFNRVNILLAYFSLFCEDKLLIAGRKRVVLEKKKKELFLASFFLKGETLV